MPATRASTSGNSRLVEALRFGHGECPLIVIARRVLRVYPGQLLQRAEGGGVIAGADAAPAYAEPVTAAVASPVDDSMDVAEPMDAGRDASGVDAARRRRHQGGKASRRGCGEPASAKKAAPEKAPAAKKRVAKASA